MTYLNTAAESIPPLCVREALETYWQDKLRGMNGREAHYAKMERCREAAARMLRLTPAEISFCSCSAEAYNLLATALNLQPKDEVVINDLDFPSGATPWLTSPTPLAVKVWKSLKGALNLDDLVPLLNLRTRLVQVSLVSFYNGYRLEWAPFVQCVRQQAPAAILAVDVTQALGRIVLDCSDADCIVSSTHKWVLGFHGGCIVGIPQRRAAALTTCAGGWFHLTDAFGSDRFERAVPKTGAASYSVGMPNFAAIYALDAALRYVEQVGVEAIAAHADPLAEQLYQALLELGLTPMAPSQPGHRSGILSFRHPNSTAIHADLERGRVHVMHHAGRLRVSLHGYNSADDVERLITALRGSLKSNCKPESTAATTETPSP
jgi:selenocysteine lyase/cysteine desulfurase